MKHYKSIADYKSANGLTPPEERLVAACRNGEPCPISDTRPESLTTETTIRADLLAFLISGKDSFENPRPHSLLLSGANIVGDLDLSYTSFFGDIRLHRCVFHNRILAIRAKSNLLSLEGSYLSGLTADGTKFSSSVYLTQDFRSTRQVSFAGAGQSRLA